MTFDSTRVGPCDIDNLCNASIPSLIENHFEFDKMDVFRVSSPLIFTVNITMIFEVFSLQKVIEID